MADIIHFPVVARPIPTITAQPAPGYLRSWLPFLAVVACNDVEALPIRGHAEDEGPAIVYNPLHTAPEDMEDASIAMMWLSPCLLQIAREVLEESLAAPDGIGRFRSDRWEAFRKAVNRTFLPEWSGEDKEATRTTVLRVARAEGLDFAADNIVAHLLIESRLNDYLEAIS